MTFKAWRCSVCDVHLTCTENGWLCSQPGAHTGLISDYQLAVRLHDESKAKYKDRCDSFSACRGQVAEKRSKLLPTGNDLILQAVNGNMEDD